jgi:hypothetical protein
MMGFGFGGLGMLLPVVLLVVIIVLLLKGQGGKS